MMYRIRIINPTMETVTMEFDNYLRVKPTLANFFTLREQQILESIPIEPYQRESPDPEDESTWEYIKRELIDYPMSDIVEFLYELYEPTNKTYMTGEYKYRLECATKAYTEILTSDYNTNPERKSEIIMGKVKDGYVTFSFIVPLSARTPSEFRMRMHFYTVQVSIKLD